jgi:hypothetical protein
MSYDPATPPTGLRELLGSTLRYIRNVSNAVSQTGFDLAHMIGREYWRQNLELR